VVLSALELDDGAVELLVEPLAAPLSCLGASEVEDALDEDDGAAGEVLSEPLALVEPPEADGVLGVVVALDEELSFFFDASIDTDPDVEPAAGADGVVVEPAEEEDAEPAGGVVRETARSPSLSQPVRIPAPSARETATAKVVSFICYVLRGLG
jgi:hypothetical protein